MVTDLKRADLHQAASLLLAVGCTDTLVADPAARLHCLWAGELLRTVGARPGRIQDQIPDDDVACTVRAALAALASLPPELASLAAVVDAAETVRDAVETVG
jgi:hypothetical protein